MSNESNHKVINKVSDDKNGWDKLISKNNTLGRESKNVLNQKEFLKKLRFSYTTQSIQSQHYNQSIGFTQLVQIIEGKKSQNFKIIRDIVYTGFEEKGLSGKEVKKLIAPYKINLPFFLLGGYTSVGKSNAKIDYNGCFQVDFDCKQKGGHQKAIELQEMMEKLDYVLLSTISPSGVGVKALIMSNNTDKSKHLGYAHALNMKIIKDTGFEVELINADGSSSINEETFDALPVTQACFVPYNTNVYKNLAAKILICEDLFKEFKNAIPQQILSKDFGLKSGGSLKDKKNVGKKTNKSVGVYDGDFEATKDSAKHLTHDDILRVCEMGYNKAINSGHSNRYQKVAVYWGICNGFGIGRDFAMKYILEKKLIDDEDKRYTARDGFYKTYIQDFGKTLLSKTKSFKDIEKERIENVLKNGGKIIEINKDYEFLGQMEGFELPNGVFNKRITGCGGTSVALQNKQPYIICVPLKELIDNKCFSENNVLCEVEEKENDVKSQGLFTLNKKRVFENKFKNLDTITKVLGIHGDLNKKQEDLKYYLEYCVEMNLTPKIMVTYDSLDKVVYNLDRINSKNSCETNVFKDFKLLVDEYHMTLTEYAYRSVGINKMLDCAKNFEYKTFMTATPYSGKYKSEYFKDLDYTELKWENVMRIVPTVTKSSHPITNVCNIIRNYKAGRNSILIDGNVSTEAYFFINSVKSIAQIIRKENLSQEDVKVVCSDNFRNRETLYSATDGDTPGIKISKASDKNKTFTFITSKAFVGCDFYSESGMIYIISMRNNKNTLLDIGTHISQIAGRIRNKENPFRGSFNHIYQSTYTGVDVCDEKVCIEREISKMRKGSKDYIESYNGDLKHLKGLAKKKLTTVAQDEFVKYDSIKDEFCYDEMKEFNHEFHLTNEKMVYTNGMSIRASYVESGIESVKTGFEIPTTKDKIFKFERIANSNFHGGLTEYAELRLKIKTTKDSTELKNIKTRQNALKEMFSEVKEFGVLPLEVIKKNKTKKQLFKALYNNSTEMKEQLNLRFNKVFNKGFYSSKEIKKTVKMIYDELGYTEKPKATDILGYVDGVSRRTNFNGKQVKGIEII